MYVMQLVKKIVMFLLQIIFRMVTTVVPVNEKAVVFMAFHGRGCLDNPEAIYEKMKKMEAFKDYKFIWVLNVKDRTNIQETSVKYLSIPYFYYMARCKYWIVNCKLPLYIYKKKKQVYVQTWHGTPLKRLGMDISVNVSKFSRSGLTEKQMQNSYINDAKKYDYMVSPNKFSTKVFQSAFQIKKECLIETGYPRNDFISKITEKEIEGIKKKWNIPLDKKVILYAPTWRDNKFNVSGYTFELNVDFKKWKENLEEEYVVIFKPHYLIVNKYENAKEFEGFLFNIDAKVDIKSFYVISDILITDYSSVFFDYAILNRPIYFYMYDLKEYEEEMRGFYLDINKDLPGEIFEEEDGLLKAIKNNVCQETNLEKFNNRFNYLEDGNSSKRVIDIVFGLE